MIHYYPWYINDWKSSATWLELGLMSKGLYRELLDSCFHFGSLPTDEALLQKMAGCTRKEFISAWPSVKRQFVEREGRYYNAKVSEMRPKLEEKIEKRAVAGRASGKARREQVFNRCSTHEPTLVELSTKPHNHITTGVPPYIPPTGEPSPQAAPKKKRTPPVKLDPEREAWFMEWYAVYPLHIDPGEARKQFLAHVKTREECDLAIEAVKQGKGGISSASAKNFIPYPGKWLKRTPWKPDIPEPEAPLFALTTNQQRPAQQTYAERNEQLRNQRFIERMAEEITNG